MSEREDDFLSRWSRRKSGARDGALQKVQDKPVHVPGRMRTDPPAPKVAETVDGADGDEALVQQAALKTEQPIAQVEEPAVAEARPQEPVDPSEFDKIDFDKLNYASDYTQFLKEGVPEAVRRRALRVLWSSNPLLANLDGLNDYDEDFTDAALVMKVFSSNYKPGSGYLTEEELQASYSEEARKAGPQPVEDEKEEIDPEDLDVEDMDDEEDSPGDVQIASAESSPAQGESDDSVESSETSAKNEKA